MMQILIPILAALLTGGAVGLVIFSMSRIWEALPRAERQHTDPLPFGVRLLWPFVALITPLVGRRLSPLRLEQAHRDLQTAGQSYVLGPEELYALRVVGALVVVLLGLLVMGMLGKLNPLTVLYGVVGGGLVGYLYPSLWLKEQRDRRTKQIIRDLPIYLDFITVAVEAGLNITGAIEQSARRGPQGPLAQEFMRLLRDLRAGLPRAEALARMSDRVNIQQITSFTGALIQADRVGASIGDTMRAQSSQRREERFQRAEKLALEAPVKMMAPLMMFFFPLVFIVLVYFIYLKVQESGIL